MEAKRQGSPEPGRGYIVVIILAGLYALSFLDRQLLSILAEPVKKDLGLSDTQLGLLTGLTFALFYTVFGIPVARLADRSHRVRIVSASCALWSLFTALCGSAQNFGQIALARVGVGVGEAGGSPPSYSIIADYFPAERRAGAFAIYALGVPVGTAAGAAVGGLIAASYGWRMAFYAIGLFGIFYAFVVLFAIKEPKRGGLDSAQEETVPLGRTLRAFVTEPVLALTSLAGGLSAFVGYAMLSWTPALLMRTKGMTLNDVAAYYSVISGVAAAIGTLAVGWLVDRLVVKSQRMYALVPAVVTALSAPFFLVGVAMPTWQGALLMLIVPLALYAAYLAPAMAVINNAVLPGQRSTATAVLQLVLNLIGLGGGPLYVGAISDAAAEAGYASSLQLAMFALGPVFLLAAFVHYLASRALSARQRRADENTAAA